MYNTDQYPNDDNIKMAYSLAIKEGEAEPRDLQVLLVGAENTGKTSLISSFLGEKFVEGRSATEGAEVEMCKIYSYNWRRMNESDKINLLHHQFIDQFRNFAQLMPVIESNESSAPSSHNVTESTDNVVESIESVSTPPNNFADESISELHPLDVIYSC